MTPDGLPGAPLDAAGLDAILERHLVGKGYPMDVPDLVNALRAAWREREEWANHVIALSKEAGMLKDETERYRAALGHYADEENWGLHPDFLEDSPHDWYMPNRAGYESARAALGAPGAREETTT